MLTGWSKVSKPLQRHKHTQSPAYSFLHILLLLHHACCKSPLPEDLWRGSWSPRACTRQAPRATQHCVPRREGRPADQIVPKAEVQLCHCCALSTPPCCCPAPCRRWDWMGTVGWRHTHALAGTSTGPAWLVSRVLSDRPWEGTSLPWSGSRSLFFAKKGTS